MSAPSSDEFIPSEVPDTGLLLDGGDFGIWQLTVQEAAVLVVLDQWFQGALKDSAVPEDCDDEYDPRVKAALADGGVITDWEKRLLAAVERGSLKETAVRRDKDERPIAGKTLIRFQGLVDWLRERGYETGEVVARWWGTHAEMREIMVDQAASLRAASAPGKRMIDSAVGVQEFIPVRWEEADAPTLRGALRLVVAENRRLKVELAKASKPAKVDRPITTMARRTLLVIIAALLSHAKIDYRARGLAKSIEKMTDDIESHIDEETIRNALSEMGDALVSRKKYT